MLAQFRLELPEKRVGGYQHQTGAFTTGDSSVNQIGEFGSKALMLASMGVCALLKARAARVARTACNMPIAIGTDLVSPLSAGRMHQIGSMDIIAKLRSLF